MRETSIEYVAGLFDGEGCVTWIARYGTQIIPSCQISMTDHETLEVVYFTLKRHSVGTYMRRLHPPSHILSNRKPQTHLIWAGALRTRALLELLLPHLITKRGQALAMLAFIYSRHLWRVSEGHNASKFAKGDPRPVTDDEWELLNYIKELNSRGLQILNEHTLDSRIEMMCSELHQKYVEAAEMSARLIEDNEFWKNFNGVVK